MKSNFEERKANRLEAFENLAAKNKALSQSSYEHSNQLANVIPLGQPILVGHHSEKRHRKHVEKIHNAMSKSVEADRKAAYYKERAESLLNGTAISSDDPTAIDQLKEKMKKLEDTQELYKEINKAIKTGLKKKLATAEIVATLVEFGLKEDTAAKLLNPSNFGGMGIPSFRITNNGANIRRIKERITHLENTQAIPESEEEINGVKLVVNQDDNRVQMFFPDKPNEAVRKELKSYGFHYSPTNEAWQRLLSNNAIYYAKKILNNL